MFPDEPMQPGPGEAPLTLELGAIVFAIGVLILLIIVAKLTWEWWRGKREEQHDSTSQ